MATKDVDNVQETLGACLSILLEEADTANVRTALQTLHKLMKNVQANPSEEKFRHVRKENKAFSNKVWRYVGAQQFMMAAGWEEVDNAVVLTDVARLNSALKLLETQIQQLTEEPPGSVGGQDKTQPIPQQTNGSHTAWTDRELSDKEKQIAAERRKLQEQLKKEKQERKRISEQIKADRREANTREVKESHARHLDSDGGMKRFDDIGINLNKGGG